MRLRTLMIRFSVLSRRQRMLAPKVDMLSGQCDLHSPKSQQLVLALVSPSPIRDLPVHLRDLRTLLVLCMPRHHLPRPSRKPRCPLPSKTTPPLQSSSSKTPSHTPNELPQISLDRRLDLQFHLDLNRQVCPNLQHPEGERSVSKSWRPRR